VIRTGVDVAEQPIPTEAAGPLRLVVAANLVEVKGHVYLLRALARLRRDAPVRLDVIGDGPLRAHLEQTATTLGIRGLVTFDGAVSHEDFLRRLRDGAWDVCVLPSIVTSSGEQEGIPVSLLEAMSAAVPVVATSTGAIPELLDDGAGVLVPPEDPQALAEALTRLAGDPSARAAIGDQGRARVRSEFDVRRTTERLVAEIRSCGGGRG
jgi:glycosyltransferase involved in cell wall biosynthesis